MEPVFETSILLQIRLFTEMPDNVVQEFIDNCVYQHPWKSKLLCNLSDLYVLVAMRGTDRFLSFDEKRWKDVLSSDHYKLMCQNEAFILGFMLISPIARENIRFINYIDTRVRGYNLAKCMIEKYKSREEVALLPGEISESAVGYWRKFFHHTYDITDVNDLTRFMKEHNISSYDWEPLLDLLEFEESDMD